MRIAILGGPGSGKGTQARMLSERYRVPHISAGDLLREAVKNDKKLGDQVKEAMDTGHLVDDDIVLKLLDERLRKKDTKRGFIIDGYPRNIPQAQSLDALLGLLGRALQISVNMDVDDEILVKRISGRIMCDSCGAIYNKHFSPTKKRNICDACGGKKFLSREDDKVKTAEVRVQVYHDNTQPLIAYYRAQHKLRTVIGKGDIGEIQEKLCDIIDLEIRPLEIKSMETASETHDEIESTIIAGGQINRVLIEAKKKPVRKKKVLPKAAVKPAAPTKAVTKSKVLSKNSAAKPVSTSKKKPAGKKVVKKTDAKADAKKVPVKKTPVKKATIKKPVVKQPSDKDKKATSKKATSKKATSKKATSKKAMAKKLISTKGVKKTATKKPVAKKMPKKQPVKKTASKKTAKRKSAKKSPQKP